MLFDKEIHKNIKVIALDLDGTLTQHKQPLEDDNKKALELLAKKYKLIMVGAGQVMRIRNQLGRMKIDIIGNYGLQYGEYDESIGNMKIIRNLTFDCDRESIEKKVTAFREKHGFTEYRGDNVEFHPSGCVTIPLLGTKALIEDKIAFDPTREKRRKIYAEVKELFSDYTVFIGDSSSFDMTPGIFDKYHALDTYCLEKGFSHENIVFIGDDYELGGNDESVYLSDIPFIKIDDYKTFPSVCAPLI